jgi:hypothetical protein
VVVHVAVLLGGAAPEPVVLHCLLRKKAKNTKSQFYDFGIYKYNASVVIG